MYELNKINNKTYYIECPSKIGIYLINQTDIILIDSGNNKDTAKKILKIIKNQGWNLKFIINTHSHADHIGGNKYLQEETNCKILTETIEDAFITYPILEPTFLYGGTPNKLLKNKFLMSEASKCEHIKNYNLDQHLEIISLKGHSPNMIGIKTKENVFFIGDAIASEETLNKYHIQYAYDINAYLETLNYLKTQNATFIPSHASVTNDINNLIKINEQKTFEIIKYIKKICETKKTFDSILKQLCDIYNVTLNMNQYVLLGSTIRSYLTYLFEKEEIIITFEDNFLYYQTV